MDNQSFCSACPYGAEKLDVFVLTIDDKTKLIRRTDQGALKHILDFARDHGFNAFGNSDSIHTRYVELVDTALNLELHQTLTVDYDGPSTTCTLKLSRDLVSLKDFINSNKSV